MSEQPPTVNPDKTENEPAINKWFRAAIKIDASDLHLKAGMVPKMRIHSKLKSTNSQPMAEEEVQKLVFEIISEQQKKFFLENSEQELTIRFDAR